MPHNVAPATAAGAEIAKDVPSGNVPNSPQLRPADSGTLVPPGDLQATQANQLQGGQVFVRQAPIPTQPAVAQMPQPREPTPEEREVATRAMQLAPDELVYARVDLIDVAGQPTLMELELIEPDLFLRMAPGSVERFAAAVAAQLSG